MREGNSTGTHFCKSHNGWLSQMRGRISYLLPFKNIYLSGCLGS